MFLIFVIYIPAAMRPSSLQCLFGSFWDQILKTDKFLPLSCHYYGNGIITAAWGSGDTSTDKCVLLSDSDFPSAHNFILIQTEHTALTEQCE